MGRTGDGGLPLFHRLEQCGLHISLDRASRVNAWLTGRDHVTPDDVRATVHAVLRHRLILSYDANADGVSADQVIDKIVELVAVPA